MKKNSNLKMMAVLGLALFVFAPSVFAAETTIKCDDDLKSILNVVNLIINVIKFVVPLIIVALAVVDVFKVVTNGKDAEGERKKAFTTLAVRFVLGILIFFVPTIASIIFNAVMPNTTATHGINCMLHPGDDKYFDGDCPEGYTDDTNTNLCTKNG